MTREDIIRMAEEADPGFHPGETGPLSESICGIEQVLKFANLVAAPLQARIAELEAALLEQIDLTMKLRDRPCPRCDQQQSLRDKFDSESA